MRFRQTSVLSASSPLTQTNRVQATAPIVVAGAGQLPFRSWAVNPRATPLRCRTLSDTLHQASDCGCRSTEGRCDDESASESTEKRSGFIIPLLEWRTGNRFQARRREQRDKSSPSAVRGRSRRLGSVERSIRLQGSVVAMISQLVE